MQRRNFRHNDLNFSYLDQGGEGSLLVALHAHRMEASTLECLSSDLAPEYRVAALDKRGHGESGHAQSYSREDYVSDLELEAFLAELQVKSPVVILGNSLGGIHAIQFASRNPHRIRRC
jgi:esterase